MSEHRRYNDDEEHHHDREEKINAPVWVQGIVYAIREIGLISVITIGLLYIYFVSINQLKENININSVAVVSAIDKNTLAMTALRHFLTHKYDE